MRAWHDAKPAFDAASPWTPEWPGLRLVEQELRSEWERVGSTDGGWWTTLTLTAVASLSPDLRETVRA
jgi:hypothetical protein